jgi:uncharacterized protein
LDTQLLIQANMEANSKMRYINVVALLLVIVGAINWLFVGVAKFDLVAALTGNSFGETSPLSSIVYILVGISGLILLPTLARWVMGSSTDSTAVGAR